MTQSVLAFTPNGGEIEIQRVFYKSGQKALVLVGEVVKGPIETNDTLEINGQSFTTKGMQVGGTPTELANSREVVGIQLNAKPKHMHHLGIQVEF